MSHAFWPHNGEQGCTRGNIQSWMSVYRIIAISTINRQVDSALMQRQDTCLRRWQWLVSKKHSFDVMNKFNRHSLCRTFQILIGFLQGLASYCKAETTFTFHFSILTLSSAFLSINNREMKSESGFSFAMASKPFPCIYKYNQKNFKRNPP